MSLQYSKTKIDKAGQILVKATSQNNETEEALEILSLWRAHHASSLDSFAKILKKRTSLINTNGDSIVAQRLKRTPSILLKLKVHKTMRLSAMQDIGGLRAVTANIKEVYSLVDLYRFSKTKHSLYSVNDYIESPKADGYRGVHMVYKLNKEKSIFLEVQMRSHLQHIWATGVEVFGTLQNSSFKSGYGNKKWLDFFALLSSVFALKEKTNLAPQHTKLTKQSLLNKTKKMIQELKPNEQLNIYTDLYQKDSILKTRGRAGNYNLILLDSENNNITIKPFSVKDFNLATKAYLELEKKYYENSRMNVVLVNSGDIKKLKLGYPNYFMDTNKLIKTISLIATDQYL